MTCRDVIEFLHDYLGHELPDAQRVEFERHIKHCPPCQNYLETYEATIRLGKDACCETSKEPPPMPEELVKAILAARARRA